MSKSRRVREEDVAAMLRLLAEVAQLPHDTRRRLEHALAGISQLLHLECVFSTRLRHTSGTNNVEPYALVTHGMKPSVVTGVAKTAHHDPFHAYVVEGMDDPECFRGITEGGHGAWPYVFVAKRLDADHARARADAADEMRQVAGCDMELAVLCPADQAGHFSTLGLLHRRDDGPRLGTREIQMARLLWGALSFLHRTPLAAVDQRMWGVRLPPRLSRVLDGLRQGLGAKQIAQQTGLSTHTVNSYTKEIYRHFGVASRAELLATFAR